MDVIRVCVEIGGKKSFATALDWPGWCRSGRDVAGALETLAAYAPRYRKALAGSRVAFPLEDTALDFTVVERLRGGGSTDFGVPGAMSEDELLPLDEAELARRLAILQAGWSAHRQALIDYAGRELRKGPRGGGRSVEQIGWHTLESMQGYLSQIGWPVKLPPGISLDQGYHLVGQEMRHGIEAKQRDELPETGPKGGKRWPVRYVINRSAWHVLDHLWEIEDRL